MNKNSETNEEIAMLENDLMRMKAEYDGATVENKARLLAKISRFEVWINFLKSAE